jgi:hypothetical protein
MREQKGRGEEIKDYRRWKGKVLPFAPNALSNAFERQLDILVPSHYLFSALFQFSLFVESATNLA